MSRLISDYRTLTMIAVAGFMLSCIALMIAQQFGLVPPSSGQGAIGGEAGGNGD